MLTQEVKELDDVADLRVIEVIEREKRSFNVGGKEFTAGQLVEQLGFTNAEAVDPGQGPLRWRTPAAAAAAAPASASPTC